MSTIDNVLSTYQSTNATQSSQSNSSGSGSAAASLGADAFMKLMVTQMQNQDPTNPMDNSQFLAQLAQFSATSGIQQLQTSFSSLAASLQSYQALQASGLVGRTVLVPGEQAYLTTGGAIGGQMTLDSSTPQLTLGIYDQSGQLVNTMNLGSQSAGNMPFYWDGTDTNGVQMPAGVYTVKATALIGGKQTAVATDVYAAVQSVNLSTGSSGIELNLAGLGKIPLSKVVEVG